MNTGWIDVRAGSWRHPRKRLASQIALPLRVGKRRVLASALRVLMPADYKGEPLTLYRGASAGEYYYGYFGFSWTTDVAIARNVALRSHRDAPQGEGVLLRTVAPEDAILKVIAMGTRSSLIRFGWVTLSLSKQLKSAATKMP